MSNNLHLLSACEIADGIKRKKFSPTEITKTFISRIEKTDSKIGAFLEIYSKEALERASALEKKDAQGILHGVPIAIKDNLCRKGDLTQCASKILSGFRPPYTSSVVESVEKEGGIILGRLNMDEFAFGSSTETSAYQTTKNPWDQGCIPGGSSGGSCASVAGREVPISLGSDTGGSIRQPAALCGVLGLKPTYGRVSRFGLIAFASSLDQIGPVGHDVKDIALLLKVISGKDAKDSTSVELDVPDYLGNLKDDVKNLIIGIPKEYFVQGIDPEVESSVKQAIKLFESHGAKCEPISLPHTEYALSVYYIIASSEASSNLGRYTGVHYGHRSQKYADNNIVDMFKKSRSEGFGSEAKRRIILGTFVLSSGYYDAYYLKAQKVRTLIKNDFDNAFKKCDVIMAPTSPTVAFKLGEKINNPLEMYLSDVFTIPVNLAGIPAISIPCGFNRGGLPIGLQIMGKYFQEQLLLNTAYAYQNMTDFYKKVPNLD